MDVRDLEEAGFLIPYSKLSPYVVEEVKCRLFDTIMSMVGGAFAVPPEEMEELRKLTPASDEARPLYPIVPSTSMEMAGFINGYLLRYADWGDTQRRYCGIGVSGHPSDALAGLFVLCDVADLPGKKLIELTHMSYQMWTAIHEKMFFQRLDIDYTSTISLILPVTAGMAFGDDPEQIQNALNLSASAGTIMEQVRPGDITNLKSGATAYATARALWCRRFGRVLQAPKSMFDGEKGWYAYVAPFQGGAFRMPEGMDAYDMCQTKLFPAFNCAQGPLDCALDLYDQIRDRMDEVKRVVVKVCEGDAKWVFRPGQAKYPPDQAEADHHLQYCLACTLLDGSMTPIQYRQEYLTSPRVHDMIDKIDMQVMTDEEYQALGGIEGAVALEIILADGSVLKASRELPEGQFTGMPKPERARRLRAVIDRKRAMLEKAANLDLGEVYRLIFDQIEETDGKAIVTAVRKSAR